MGEKQESQKNSQGEASLFMSPPYIIRGQDNWSGLVRGLRYGRLRIVVLLSKKNKIRLNLFTKAFDEI